MREGAYSAHLLVTDWGRALSDFQCHMTTRVPIQMYVIPSHPHQCIQVAQQHSLFSPAPGGIWLYFVNDILEAMKISARLTKVPVS